MPRTVPYGPPVVYLGSPRLGQVTALSRLTLPCLVLSCLPFSDLFAFSSKEGRKKGRKEEERRKKKHVDRQGRHSLAYRRSFRYTVVSARGGGRERAKGPKLGVVSYLWFFFLFSWMGRRFVHVTNICTVVLDSGVLSRFWRFILLEEEKKGFLGAGELVKRDFSIFLFFFFFFFRLLSLSFSLRVFLFPRSQSYPTTPPTTHHPPPNHLAKKKKGPTKALRNNG